MNVVENGNKSGVMLGAIVVMVFLQINVCATSFLGRISRCVNKKNIIKLLCGATSSGVMFRSTLAQQQEPLPTAHPEVAAGNESSESGIAFLSGTVQQGQQQCPQALGISPGINELIEDVKKDVVCFYYFMEGALLRAAEKSDKNIKPSIILPYLLQQASQAELEDGRRIVYTIDPRVFIGRTLNWRGRLVEFDKVFEDAIASKEVTKEGLEVAWKTVIEYLKEEALSKPTGEYCLNLARRDAVRLERIKEKERALGCILVNRGGNGLLDWILKEQVEHLFEGDIR
jgi:hypothetical protein